MYRHFKRVAGVGSGNYIYFWTFKGLSDENITVYTTICYSLNPQLAWSWKNCKHLIVYKINGKFNISCYPTLEICLFGTVSLTENADIDKYNYSGYGIEFNKQGFFHTLMVELLQM